MSYGPIYNSANVIPFSFDLSTLVRRSVATLYSNLVTRPTGQALRLGIENHIGELGSCCLSVLDFTAVVVLDYSCADEAVAKLIQRFLGADRPADVYFVARGLAEQHREPIEAVLVRHKLALVGQMPGADFVLLGEVDRIERDAWSALQTLGFASVPEVSAELAHSHGEIGDALERLAERRVVLRCETPRSYYALSSLLQS